MNDLIREHVVKRLTRSNGWGKTRREHLKKNPTCIVCGTKKAPSVHHAIPFKEVPELELEPSNLVTLCRKFKHHFTFGHLMSWRRYNPIIRKSSEEFQKLIYQAKKIDGDLST